MRKKVSPPADELPLEVLVTLDAVFRTGSFSRAAASLGITQPSVSAQIARAEGAAREPLFLRLGRGVRPTPAGEAIRPVARSAAGLRAGFAAALGEARGLVRGRLAFAASTTIAGSVVPPVVARLRARYPGLEVRVEVGNTAQVARAVRDERAELGLVEGPLEDRDLVVEPFLADELLVVVHPRDAWARERALRPSVLASRPWIAREEGSGTREVAERALAAAGVRLVPAVEVGHAEAILRLVAARTGWAILSRHLVADEVAAGRLVALGIRGVPLERRFSRVSRRHAPPSLAGKAFLEELGRTRARR